jgi:hypothetical protein
VSLIRAIRNLNWTPQNRAFIVAFSGIGARYAELSDAEREVKEISLN